MQVAGAGAASVRALMKQKFSPASGVLAYLANSTRLSRAEKQAFMRQLAELEAAEALTGDILKQIMMAIRMVEESRAQGSYAKQSAERLQQLYDQMVKELRESGAVDGASEGSAGAGMAVWA